MAWRVNVELDVPRGRGVGMGSPRGGDREGSETRRICIIFLKMKLNKILQFSISRDTFAYMTHDIVYVIMSYVGNNEIIRIHQ